jgi:outer membrane murein-binding lipoprotein Lpp
LARVCCEFAVASGILAVFYSAGCSETDVQERLQTTIDDISGQQPGILMDKKGVLSELSAATPRTLAHPRICESRLLWVHSDKAPRQDEAVLVTYWIESAPTANAVRLEWKNRHIDCPISDANARENAKDAEVAVLFTSALHFPEDSRQAFELLRSGEMPCVVLLRNGKPISSGRTVREMNTRKGEE